VTLLAPDALLPLVRETLCLDVDCLVDPLRTSFSFSVTDPRTLVAALACALMLPLLWTCLFGVLARAWLAAVVARAALGNLCVDVVVRLVGGEGEAMAGGMTAAGASIAVPDRL
jgi:hypothetical protein